MSNHYRLPADTPAQIEVHEAEIRQFRAGELGTDDFKHRRVPRGIYEQRDNGSYMLRIRIAGGALSPEQARTIAALSEDHGSDRVHVTSRQDIQLHDLALEDTPAVMRALWAVGLSSFGGGGNTVRNITACPFAGICPRQAFNVLPFAWQLTEHLLAEPSPTGLPRKYKVAFSGCGQDCSAARLQDLGFIAKVRDGEAGFELWGGGGMGAKSRVATRLSDWLPARDALRAAIAMRRIFAREGDRRNRQRARLRFVVERLGEAEFTRQFAAEFAATEAPACPSPTPDQAVAVGAGGSAGHLHRVPQRQEGFVALRVELPMGLLANRDFARIAAIAAAECRQPELRTTVNQDLILPWIPVDRHDRVAAALEALELDVTAPAVLPKFTACTGSATCRLGICRSRDAAAAAANALAEAGLREETLAQLRVHISGCPNACGRHPLAALGFCGAVQRQQDRALPAYLVLVGGATDGDGPRLADSAGRVPARRLPAFLAALLRRYEAAGTGALGDWLRQGPAGEIADLVSAYASAPPPEAAPELDRDWGEEHSFSPKRPGPGEAAGSPPAG